MRVRFEHTDFIEDPDLFRRLEYAWNSQDPAIWASVLGLVPDGRVLATHDDLGVTFHFRAAVLC